MAQHGAGARPDLSTARGGGRPSAAGARGPLLGGPRAYELAELVRGDLRAHGRHRPVLPVWTPGKAAKAFRAGADLVPDRAVGHRTWEQFLTERDSVLSTR